MQTLLRSWIGRGRPFSVEHASKAVDPRIKTEWRRTRRVRSWLEKSEPKTSEFLALCRLFGPKFTNEALETVGQTGAITIKGWASEEELGKAMADTASIYFDKTNGKKRRLRRALLRVIRLARARLNVRHA